MKTITSRKNPVAMHLKKLGNSRAYREERGEFLCDGIKLLEEAVSSGIEIVSVITSNEIPLALPSNTAIYNADRELIDSLSPLKNSQDTLFSCKTPPNYMDGHSEFKGTHILLDGMQDPGNVGAIIRTADAFNIDSVILTEGCADPFNPKTIRASMGAIFRQRINNVTMAELLALKESGTRFVGAAQGEDCLDIRSVRPDDAIIAIGSEGQGLSSDVLSLCDEKITIPIAPQCESLNAATAAAIIIWQYSAFRIPNCKAIKEV